MKKIVGSLLIASSMFSMEYYSKVEPINTYNIKSSVSGKVVFVNKNIESNIAKNNSIIKIDSKVNSIDLKQSKLKLKTMKNILDIEKDTLKSYKRISSKSKFDKDNQKIKILNIQSSISDLITKIATLEDTISNKNLIATNSYIYNIAVKIGDFVNPGNLLYTAMDLTKAKFEIFIPIDKANTIQNKIIYINDKKTNLKISKLYSVADTQHITSYKCKIIIPNPKTFSNLVKVEFK